MLISSQELAAAPECALSDLNVGESGNIVRVGLRGRARRRLLEMGFVAGERVRLERVAPLGDPLAVRLKGYQLALRKADAERIWVTNVD
jgi:ferrous iron transport protein A